MRGAVSAAGEASDPEMHHVLKGHHMDWDDIEQRAMVYVLASAWESAETVILSAGGQVIASDAVPTKGVRVLGLLVICWRRQGKLDAARQGTRQIARILESADEMSSDARMLAMICIINKMIEDGDYARASATLDELRPLRSSDAWVNARLKVIEAKLLLRKGQLSESESAALAAAVEARRAQSEGQVGDAYILLATIAKQRGRVTEACGLYGQAGAQYAAAGDDSALAMVELNRGLALGTLGRVKVAKSAFEDALAHAEFAGRPASVLRCKIGAAWCEMRMGWLHEARGGLLGTWRLARRLGLIREEAIALEYLVQCYVLLGLTFQARCALGVIQ